MTLYNWDQVQANVKELCLSDALNIRGFIFNQKIYEDSEVMSTLMKDLDEHIINIGRKKYAEENLC